MARPTDYTAELASEICARMSDGQSIRTITKADDMPSAATIYMWLRAHKEFVEQYEICQQDRAHGLAEESMEIADDGRNDWMERQSSSEKGAGVNTGWVLNGEHVQRSRLRIDTRKWYASKLAPKKYGEKIVQEQTGPEGGPIRHIIERTIVDPKNGA